MTRRVGLVFLVIAVMAGCRVAMGQVGRDPGRAPASGQLPFSTLPERLPGPPRADGELPAGRSQPPTDLPGRLNEAPNAEGVSPRFPFAPRPRPLANPFQIPDEMRRFTPSAPTDLPIAPLELEPLTGPLSRPGVEGVADERATGPIEPIAMPEDSSISLGDSILLPRVPREGVTSTGMPLRLGEVLASAERFYPPYLAFLQERGVAAAEVLEALGGFDLGVNIDARNWGLSYYKRYVYDALVDQPTTLWGSRFFAGYRLAVGDWPPYYQYIETRGGGAYIAGLELPFLRGGRIDARRAIVYQAEIDRRRVEPDISRERIALLNQAAKSYWAWLAAGKSYRVYENLLELAVKRNDGLEEQVEQGAVAPVELVDNQRVIIQRRQALVGAKRRFQQAGVELSLFARDSYGLPLLPESERLPTNFPSVDPPRPDSLGDDIQVALRLRPELPALRMEVERFQVDRDLAENQLLPGMNLYLYAEQNVGEEVPLRNKGPFILESSILFDVPLQRRAAKGRLRAADTQIRQVRFREQFMQQRITADVQNGMTALIAAHDLLTRAEALVEVNRRLEEAERRKFPRFTTILLIYFREQITAESEIQAIDAEAEFFDAIADYRAALGIDALPLLPPSDRNLPIFP